ncbi:MAG: Gfo/Idh/MocA family oxidoreductase [Bryobacterales bacterium]|nr:Gfo/Idh/MocA family oxidoreductase [Bryobacterales bacterium]
MKRRSFLNSVPLAAASTAVGQPARPAPSGRVTLGVIGTGNQGIGDMRGFLRDPRVQVLAVCDVNRMSAGYWDGALGGREPARAFVEWHYAREKRSGAYKGCDAYEDFRDLLARKDIDAVLIALPDHWHSIPVILAARAGKDIYGEKPLSLTIAEGRAMADAVRDHKRIFQTGSQQRSDARFRKACELVRNGRIGKLHTVSCGLPGGTPDFSRDGHRRATEPVPEGFNYNMWLGPAPEAPYCPARCHVNFRWILDYSGGQLTDWGGHHPDIAQWGMGTELTGPVEIRNARGKWAADGLYNTATEFTFEAIYANGVRMVVSNRSRGGVTFEGSDGMVWVNRGAIESKPDHLIYTDIADNEIHLYKSENHFRNFIDCVLSRKQPVSPIEETHRSITIAHLGNIALKLGRDLKWDPAAERFVNDAEAGRMLARPMRAPWSLPAA